MTFGSDNTLIEEHSVSENERLTCGSGNPCSSNAMSLTCLVPESYAREGPTLTIFLLV